MAAIPALSKTYSSRANVPFASTASALDRARSCVFNLIQHLLNTATGGTTSGTRDANSVWTVKGSSDGVSNVSTAGVNHIAARTNLVWAGAGTNHSWIWLENATLGYQLVIDCINSTNSNISITACPIATPYTGGSLTNRPINTAAEISWSTNSTGESPQGFISDSTTGGTNQTHFVTSTDGQFTFLTSRTGHGMFSINVSLLKTVNNAAGDTRNVFWLGHSLASSRGCPAFNTVANAASGCSGRNPNGVAVMSSGGIDPVTPGSTAYYGSGAGLTDAITGKYNIVPCSVWSAGTSQFAYRGTIPDWYQCPPVLVGTSIPSAAAQTRIVAGDFIIPFPGVVPTV